MSGSGWVEEFRIPDRHILFEGEVYEAFVHLQCGRTSFVARFC